MASFHLAMDVDVDDDEDVFEILTQEAQTTTKRKRTTTTSKTKKANDLEGDAPPKKQPATTRKRARKAKSDAKGAEGQNGKDGDEEGEEPKKKKKRVARPRKKKDADEPVLALPEDEDDDCQFFPDNSVYDRWCFVKSETWYFDGKMKVTETQEDTREYKYLTPLLDEDCYFDFLPCETIFYIFSFLYGNELLASSLVCSEWHAILKDKRLWDCTILRMTEGMPDTGRYELYTPSDKLVGTCTDTCATIASYMRYAPNLLWTKTHERRLIADDIDGEQLYAPVPVLKRKTEEDSSESMWRWWCVRINESQFEGRLYANIGLLEIATEKGLRLPEGYELIWNFLRSTLIWNHFTEERLKKQSIPVDAGVLPPQPKRVTNTKLYGYQLETLGWMKTLEDKIIRKDYLKFSPFAEWPAVNTSLLFDIDGEWLYPAGTNLITLKTKGGIVADEMGLGKTLTLLSLVTINPQRELHRVLDKVHPSRLRSRATLVICPSHVCKEWATEMRKQMSPPIKLHEVTTMHQMKKLSLWDALNADVICISFQLLNNKNYLSLPTPNRSYVNQINEMVAEEVKAGRDPNAKLKTEFESFRLNAFYYHRVIIDEAHEVRDVSALAIYDSTFRWYVSGTPFPQGDDSAAHALDFLNIDFINREEFIDITKDNYLAHRVRKLIWNHLYIRHIKEKVHTEYTLPPLTEKIILVEQSMIEKGLYNLAKYQNKSEAELRKLCCYVELSGDDETPRSMETIRKYTIDQLGAQILTNMDCIRQAKSKIKRMRARITTLEDSQQETDGNASFNASFVSQAKWNSPTDLKEEIDFQKRGIRRKREDNVELQKFMDYFEKHALPPKPLPLPISKEKAKEKVNENRTNGQEKEKEKEKEKESTDTKKPSQLVRTQSWRAPSTLEDLVNMYGAKLGHIVMTLREILKDPTHRVIIFSQWDKMLHRVSNILNESGIANAFCQGNVYCRNNAISQFRGEPAKRKRDGIKVVRVLMLSFSNAASGTNLQDATHIIMIDPMGGAKNEAKDIEAQAIGRAHRLGQKKEITLLRFIIKDTVEYELYQRNQAGKS